MKTQRKKLVLLDAHAIIHRAYHGMPDFTTRTGVPTGAIYGFITMILKIIDDFKPDYIVACYDLPGPTFRHESYSDYKGTRSKTDEALKMQFPVTREVCDMFSIPIYDAAGFEADDILGTISTQLKDEPIDIIIASGDMDTLQLVDGNRVRVFTLKRGMTDTVVYDEPAVIERFGFKPLSIIDYKAFKGDYSDNIPGIRGIGDKAATLAIKAFGTMEATYKALEKDEQNLLEIGLTKRMVGLIREGREEAEFSKVLATIRHDAPITFSFPEHSWRDAIDVDGAMELFQKYELRSLPKRLEQTLGITAESVSEKKPEIIDEALVHKTAIALCLLDSEKTDADVDAILEHTGKQSFAEATKAIFAELASTPLLQKVYDEIEEPLIPLVNQMTKNGIKIDKDFFAKLSKQYHDELSAIEKKIYSYVDEEFNIKSPKQLSEVLFGVLGLPTKGIKKSKTGTYSTNIDMLEKLRDEHPIIEQVIEYRELQKLLSTYIDVIPTLVEGDGRLHAEFLQHGTATGRFSSRHPNLQNIPTRTEHGRRIRKGFVAEAGSTFVSLDYSQIELRILAMLSGDEGLIEIFKDGRDIHTAVASQIAGVPEAEVDRVTRNKAKAVNFGILYGMGVNSLKKEMNSTREEAQMFYNGFFENFPKATAFLEATKQYARDHGYTETLFGRRRQFKNINASLPFIRAMAERMALNAPIQGTNADIVKLAMISLSKHITEHYPNAKLILQIHDELVYELPIEKADTFAKEAKDIMERILMDSFLHYDAPVPLVVHSSTGTDWGELK
jgi:DNA polymerase-1